MNDDKIRITDISGYNFVFSAKELKKQLGISELENHDIFKIWKSIRKGGKTTLDAMLNLNQGIAELRELSSVRRNELRDQLTELKEAFEKREEHQFHDYSILTNIKEVLRELNQIVKGLAFDINSEGILTAFLYTHYRDRLQENEAKLDSQGKTEYQTLMDVHLETIKKYQAKACECDKLKLKVSELETLLEVAGQEIKELLGDKID